MINAALSILLAQKAFILLMIGRLGISRLNPVNRGLGCMEVRAGAGPRKFH